MFLAPARAALKCSFSGAAHRGLPATLLPACRSSFLYITARQGVAGSGKCWAVASLAFVQLLPASLFMLLPTQGGLRSLLEMGAQAQTDCFKGRQCLPSIDLVVRKEHVTL